MSTITTYRPLFQLDIFHKFFLDDGLTPFDTNETVLKKQLQEYNWNSFGKIVPTAETKVNLQNHRMLLKPSPLGFVVLIEAELLNDTAPNYTPLIALDQDLKLEFYIQLLDPKFYNYTDLDPAFDSPLFLSNHATLYNAAAPVYLARHNEESNAKNHSVSEAFKDFLIKKYGDLRTEKPFIISLKMRDAGSGLNLVLLNGTLPQHTPHFKIVFHNRKTIWRYYSVATKVLIYTTEPEEKPLVQHGIVPISNAGTDYPTPTPSRIYQDRDTDGSLIKTYSNIYIN